MGDVLWNMLLGDLLSWPCKRSKLALGQLLNERERRPQLQPLRRGGTDGRMDICVCRYTNVFADLFNFQMLIEMGSGGLAESDELSPSFCVMCDLVITLITQHHSNGVIDQCSAPHVL